MHPLIVPGLITAASAAGLLWEARKKGPPIATLVSAGTAPDGSPIQSLKPDVASQVIQAINEVGIDLEDDRHDGMVFRLVAPNGGVTAAQAAVQAHADGLVVMVSHSVAEIDPDSTEPGYMLLCDPSQRKLASPHGKLVILLDQSRTAIAPRASAPMLPQFDANLPANVLAVVQKALADASPDLITLRRQADTLEARQHPIAAKALRERADAIELERELLGTPGEPVIATPETEPDTALLTPPPAEVAGEPAIEAEPAPQETVEEAPEPSPLNGAHKPFVAQEAAVTDSPAA